MSGLARAGPPAAAAAIDAGGAEAGADIDRQHRAPLRPHRRGGAPSVVRSSGRKMRQRRRDRFEIVHQHDRHAASARRSRRVDRPCVVGQLDGVAFDRTGGRDRGRRRCRCSPPASGTIGGKRIHECREIRRPDRSGRDRGCRSRPRSRSAHWCRRYRPPVAGRHAAYRCCELLSAARNCSRQCVTSRARTRASRARWRSTRSPSGIFKARCMALATSSRS